MQCIFGYCYKLVLWSRVTNILRPIHQSLSMHINTTYHVQTLLQPFAPLSTHSTAWWQLAHGVLVWCCHSRRNGHLLNGQGATLSEELEYLTHGVLHCQKNRNIKQAGRDVVIATRTMLKKSHVKPRWAPGAVVWTCGLAVAYCTPPMAC